MIFLSFLSFFLLCFPVLLALAPRFLVAGGGVCGPFSLHGLPPSCLPSVSIAWFGFRRAVPRAPGGATARGLLAGGLFVDDVEWRPSVRILLICLSRLLLDRLRLLDLSLP